MKLTPAVKRETMHIGVGTLALSAIMLIVFALLGKLDYRAVLGALLGGGFAVFNFFLLGLTVQKAAMLPPEQAKLKMRSSYTGRMFLTLLVGGAGMLAPCFNWVAVLAPLLFPRITIALMHLFKLTGKEAD